MTVNASFVSPTADAKVAHMITQFDTAGLIATVVNGFTVWKAVLALFIGAVLYDQFMYIWQKGSIVGPAMKTPFMGPFLESVNPSFKKYHEKWLSGSLSCVSVFHKYALFSRCATA
ncbi:hypothetical protein OPT61_g9202 [Boeremia exigua]|uniref:Uncharacterized protein n=1 Tax=Boeremia exigua TaxID=749465 RepID=A0ACC2HV34_9PLEO|nr:hypothetical protein OPT61_g9202 [Boeremia exigua]